MLIWFLIAVSIAAVLGPLLSALPSKQQRAVARFRDRARQSGIQVRMSEPKGVPPRLQRVSDSPLVAYGRRLPKISMPPAELWVRTRAGWEARSGEPVPGLLGAIQQHIEVVQLDAEYLQVFWDERGGEAVYEQVERLLDPEELAKLTGS
ncbi:MAG: hypothetical protein PVJ95_09070 [Cellvibrionales bacterium]